jgi:hypothetical protein
LLEFRIVVGNPKEVRVLTFVVLEEAGTIKAHVPSAARRNVRRDKNRFIFG